MKRLIILFFVSFAFQANYGNLNKSLDSRLEHINFVEKIPEHINQKILMVSNRYFDLSENFTYARFVHPDRKLHFFVVSFSSDSSYMTVYNSLDEAMQVFSEDQNFLVFVHGHGKNFEQTIQRGFEINSRYNTNTVVFDWPTDYLALRKTAKNARKVTSNFVTTVSQMQPILESEFPDSKISVIFHSMGNHILRKMVTNGNQNSIDNGFFDNLILNAPAVKQQNHSKWINNLSIQKRVYIVSNDNDFPLKGASLLRLSKQLGLGIKGTPAENAQYIDFSRIADKEHNLFLGLTKVEEENPELKTFYKDLFDGKEPLLPMNNDFLAEEYDTSYFIF